MQKQMAAVHYRQKISKGTGLIAEWGLIQDTPNGSVAKVGSYNLIQALILLTRGYNLKTTIERYNQDFQSSTPDQWKWSLGFLCFPVPRLEIRAEIIDQRQFSGTAATDDSWAMEGQIHVSL